MNRFTAATGFWIACAALSGQTISVASPSAAAGATLAADVILKMPRNGPQAAAVEWTILFSSRDFSPTDPGAVIDPSRQAEGKVLACRGSWRKANLRYAYHCLLTGGTAPLADGPLATMRFQVRPAARPASHPLQVEHPQGVTPAAKAIRMKGENGTVKILVSPV